MFDNVRVTFGQVLKNLQKSSKSGRKILIFCSLLCSRGTRTISHSFAALTSEILFLPLEHKIHILSPPCNILYIFSRQMEAIVYIAAPTGTRRGIGFYSYRFICSFYRFLILVLRLIYPSRPAGA